MKKKWRLQFGIRSLLAAMLVVALAVAATLVLRAQAEARSTAFKHIESHGGVFGYKLSSNATYRRGMAILGVDEQAFWETDYFIFGPNCAGYNYESPINDKQLESLSQSLKYFPQLKELGFEGCKYITDSGIETLPPLPNLKSLDVRGTEVSEAAIARLTERYPNATIKH